MQSIRFNYYFKKYFIQQLLIVQIIYILYRTFSTQLFNSILILQRYILKH